MERWTERWSLLAVLCAALAVRALPLLFGVEHYGDAPVRIEAAERWAQDPHLWRGFSEAFQYGPLHLTLLGGAVRLFGRFAGPKLLSLACGLVGIWLVHRLARRAAGSTAALVAGLGLAFSPLHAQASTTGASEAVFLALLLGSIDRLLAGRAMAAAVLVGLGGLVRYDGWLYVPLMAALLWRRPRAAAAFIAIAAAPAALWLLQCWRADGDALSAIRHIQRDHQMLAERALGWFGQVRWRLYALGYWPIALLAVCTPLVGAAAVAGSLTALGRWLRERRAPGDREALALLAWGPAAFFTFRAAVLADFRPMGRFAIAAGALALPFAWEALARLPLRRAVLALAALAMVGTPAGLALAAHGRTGSLAEWARPLSPLSTVPPGIEEAARWLRANARADDVVLLDGTWHYLDIPLAFESGLEERRFVRRAWPDFEYRLRATPPTLAVLLDGGSLRQTPGASSAHDGAAAFELRGARFCAAVHFVYASVYRRCPAP